MKKNCLIVISNFYPVISNNLLKGTIKNPKRQQN